MDREGIENLWGIAMPAESRTRFDHRAGSLRLLHALTACLAGMKNPLEDL
jgi:hypothetical protein